MSERTCFKNISLQKFGRLTAVFPIGRGDDKQIWWECLCDCGSIKAIRGKDIRNGKTISCGCASVERCSQKGRQSLNFRHGRCISRTYKSWAAMRGRCLCPTDDHYSMYGGRGITICPQWDSFAQFLADMGERPVGKSLERRDVNGNYDPGNCCWATQKEQAKNRRKFKALGNFTTEEILAELARRNWNLVN